MNKRFWMVWSPDGRAPTRRHLTIEEATKEAERLTNELPHVSHFYVLEAVSRVQIAQRPIEVTPLSNEPFTPEERAAIDNDDGIPF